MESSSGAGQQATATGPKPLSCVSCRQRKVKCNKVRPCTPCQKSGLSCVFPSRVRVPRNKQGSQTRDTELLRRISRLESLVSKVDAAKALAESREAAPGSSSASPSMESPAKSGHETPPNHATIYFTALSKGHGSKYLSDEFWASLGDEVGGLRQLLEHPSDDEDELYASSASSKLSPPNFLFGELSTSSDTDVFYPTPLHRTILVRRYFSNVNPICKILHQPSVASQLIGSTDLIDPETNRFKFGSLEAVSFAMYFSAVTSMTAEECQRDFGEDRHILLNLYKHNTEMALTQADFLNSMEIPTLQAFVIYLVALPCHSNDRSSWALLALAVRIAHSLGLHKDGDGRSYRFIVAEMRRRLWWQILVLDMRASEDRGSEPVITDGSFNTRLPYNLNDADFGPDTPSTILERDEMTEMAFCLMSMDVSNCIRGLNFIPLAYDRHPPTMEEKFESVKQCSHRIENVYLKGCDPSIPEMWVASMIGRLLVCKIHSVLQYPLQRRESGPRTESQEYQSLKAVVSILEISQLVENSSLAADFIWFFVTYVPWHPLAVTLAALCTDSQGPMADRAWATVDQGYQKWSDRVADTKQGMLWRPVKKLYQRAKAARERRSIIPKAPDIMDAMPSDVLLNLPDLSLQELPSSSSHTGYFNEYTALDMMAGSNVGSDWPPMTAIPSMPSGESFGGPINWDDWNEFIFDTGALGASTSPNFYGQWSTPI